VRTPVSAQVQLDRLGWVERQLVVQVARNLDYVEPGRHQSLPQTQGASLPILALASADIRGDLELGEVTDWQSATRSSSQRNRRPGNPAVARGLSARPPGRYTRGKPWCRRRFTMTEITTLPALFLLLVGSSRPIWLVAVGV
jgi:hypothetical protein